MPRVALGMGGCVDYEIAWDEAVVESLANRYRVTMDDVRVPPPVVTGVRDMLVVLLAYLTEGSGGERFVEDPGAMAAFAEPFATTVTLGGTCVRAATALDRFGVGSVVHLVSIDDDVRRLLPSSAEYLCSARQDSTDPHLIVQYPAGARVRLADGEAVAPRPNRVILVNDPPNQRLVVDAGFETVVAEADVVLVSGFNTVADALTLTDRLVQVRRQLSARRPGAVVVYEDAGFHQDEHRDAVLTEFADAVDIWSLNEDEAQHYLGRSLDLLDADAIAGAVIELSTLIGVRTLVLHTRQFALLYGDSGHGSALERGVLAATARYRTGDGWDLEDLAEAATLPVDPATATTAHRVSELLGPRSVVVPARTAATERPTTIGLGDTFVGGFLAGVVDA